jgi:serine/threonine protein phosphatase PrpC
MGNISSHRDAIPEGETPEFVQLAANAAVMTFQGFRSAMEDAYDAILGTEHGDLFAVYDGHGGKDTVTFAKQTLLRTMASMPRLEGNDIRQAFVDTERSFKVFQQRRKEKCEEERLKQIESAVKSESVPNVAAVASAGGGPPPLTLRSPSSPPIEKIDESGSCCLVAIVREEEGGKVVTVAALGDCTALLVNHDRTFSVVIAHHKPLGEIEVERILRAGLSVAGNRVNGELAVSRSMGDFQYKGWNEEEHLHAVTCVPEIVSLHIDPRVHCCLLMFSDGVSDGIENAELASLAAQPGTSSGKRAAMEASLMTSFENSRDNQVMLRIDF